MSTESSPSENGDNQYNAEVLHEAEDIIDRELGRIAIEEEVSAFIENATTPRKPIEFDHGLGGQAERYAEAMRVATWARAAAHDPGDDLSSEERNIILREHPGQSPLSYRMSKALDGKSRAELVERYTYKPESVTMPKDFDQYGHGSI